MSTTTTEFDAKAHIEEANQRQQAMRDGKPLPEPAAPVKEAVKAEPQKEEEEHSPKLPRSVRRELNKLREEAAYNKGLAEAAMRFAKPGMADNTKVSEDPEPLRSEFASDSDHQRAVNRWDARQEAKSVLGKTEESKTQQQAESDWTAHLDSMLQKSVEDRKQFEDWDAVAKAAEENEDAPQITSGSQLDNLIRASEFMAPVLYHFAKYPDELQKFLDMGEGGLTTRNFGRLEAKVEKLYSVDQKQEAAQASDKSKGESKDRHNPADGVTQPGRTAADRDVRKPRPSTEVAARGAGSVPVAEVTPANNPKAWIAQRNEMRGGR